MNVKITLLDEEEEREIAIECKFFECIHNIWEIVKVESVDEPLMVARVPKSN